MNLTLLLAGSNLDVEFNFHTETADNAMAQAAVDDRMIRIRDAAVRVLDKTYDLQVKWEAPMTMGETSMTPGPGTHGGEAGRQEPVEPLPEGGGARRHGSQIAARQHVRRAHDERRREGSHPGRYQATERAEQDQGDERLHQAHYHIMIAAMIGRNIDAFALCLRRAEDKKTLCQGDVLKKTDDLVAHLKKYHPYYADHPDYKYFMVLTQSCDLVRRKGKPCDSQYITLAAARPVEEALRREAAKHRTIGRRRRASSAPRTGTTSPTSRKV